MFFCFLKEIGNNDVRTGTNEKNKNKLVINKWGKKGGEVRIARAVQMEKDRRKLLFSLGLLSCFAALIIED